MARLLRYLRITWTSGCVVACLLLVMLWMRSYPILYSVGIRTGSKRRLHLC